ncbi:MAG TPA: hypothetical protein VEK39_14380, partial [Solirubrobacterales bacterium]|nr:hypothetical protein [Solirubrobacterales bacterium]
LNSRASSRSPNRSNSQSRAARHRAIAGRDDLECRLRPSEGKSERRRQVDHSAWEWAKLAL